LAIPDELEDFDLKQSHDMQGQEHFLGLLVQSLESIREERFFQDERGFQGALLQELGKRLANAAFPGDPIIEQEYQKRLPLHEIRIRPDIIIHVPFERGCLEDRDEGNFVAIKLKRRATDKRAKYAFANLAQMKKALKYPLTIFINIDSDQTHSRLCPKSIAGRPPASLSALKTENPLCGRNNNRRALKGVTWRRWKCRQVDI
jgi:hypothetical protein